ncbi:hypothetical protein D6779_11130 [Candidatus Parcubacteria bacterium]|nr:MAG: hypothetical protein D6779_11130 [Candidatus Parcubacteria bacterium]
MKESDVVKELSGVGDRERNVPLWLKLNFGHSIDKYIERGLTYTQAVRIICRDYKVSPADAAEALSSYIAANMGAWELFKIASCASAEGEFKLALAAIKEFNKLMSFQQRSEIEDIMESDSGTVSIDTGAGDSII